MIEVEEYSSENNDWITDAIYYYYDLLIHYELSKEEMKIIFRLYRDHDLLAAIEYNNHLDRENTTIIYGKLILPKSNCDYARWVIYRDKFSDKIL